MNMKKALFAVLAILLVVSLVAACGPDTGKADLRLRLKKGETYNLRMTADQKISQTIQGQKQDIAQTIGMGYTFSVVDVEADGTASVKVTYQSVVYKQDSPLGKFEYDSTKPGTTVPDAAKGFSALVGQGFSMKISPTGTVKDVQGVDAMLTQMIAKLDLPAGPTKDALAKSLRDQFGDQALKDSMASTMNIYPDKAVGVGESWSRKIVISTGFPLTTDNTWTLKERKNGVATIEASSKISSNPDAPPIVIDPMKLRYDLSGEQKGTLELQESTGWTIRATMTQKLSGQVKVEAMPQLPGGMTWAISIESVITVESLGK